MARLARMARGVPVRRAIAAAHLSAFEADPQLKPRIAGFEALLAALDRVGQLGYLDMIQMGAARHARQHRKAVKSRSNVERVTAPPSSTLTAVGDGDHVTGSEAPGLTLVEYGDFGCPFCFAASRPVKSLLDRFDALRLVWRHFPDTELHPGADLAAELSELAAVHGKFWEAHSLLLTGREQFSREGLLWVARRLELDEDETEAALRERSFRERVLADVAGAGRAGVHGTPAFFVDGERLSGPWRQLAQIVPAKLEKMSH
jgi:protein-disulfide isomerase